MKKYYSKIMIAFIIAVIWGYFADLKNGQIGWLIGRIIFMIVVSLFIEKKHYKK
jgi:uncharacterized membrane protein AbrB (regulator of aidB expression)